VAWAACCKPSLDSGPQRVSAGCFRVRSHIGGTFSSAIHVPHQPNSSEAYFWNFIKFLKSISIVDVTQVIDLKI
jgi:hypothetical protein